MILTMNKPLARLCAFCIAIVAIASVALIGWQTRRALVSSHSVVFGKVAVQYVTQFARENEGCWPRSWEELRSVRDPPQFDGWTSRQMVDACRDAVEIDFGADPGVLATQAASEFEAIRPKDGYELDYREAWRIDLLLDELRKHVRQRATRETPSQEP